MSATKICTKCGLTLSLERFSRNANKKDGRNSQCKQCVLAYMAERRKKNREAVRAAARACYAENAEAVKEKSRALYHANAEAERERSRRYYAEHRERLIKQNLERGKDPLVHAQRLKRRRDYYYRHREEILERDRARRRAAAARKRL